MTQYFFKKLLIFTNLYNFGIRFAYIMIAEYNVSQNTLYKLKN